MSHISDDDVFIESLYNKYSQELYKRALLFLRSKELAEDIVQELFCVAYIKCDVLKNHPNKIGWLYVTLSNLIKKYYSNKRINVSEDSDEQIQIFEVTLDEKNLSSNKVMQHLDKYFQELEFEDYKKILNDKELEMIVKRFHYGYSIEELSKEYKTSYSYISNMFHRIFKKIKKNFIISVIFLLFWGI